MIFAFSGRKGSGKTLLAQELLNRGYEKLSFATKLKKLTAELYGWSIDDLNSPIKKEEILSNPVVWNKEKANKLGEMIKATSPLNSKEIVFTARRKAMQYLGTEVLRAYDGDFHIKSIRESIQPGKNYVLDDVRFPNEIGILKEFGAKCVFLVRPYYWEYSNHPSEISLRRKDFDHVLLNDNTKERFLIKFNNCLEAIDSGEKCHLSKEKLISVLKRTQDDIEETANILNMDKKSVLWCIDYHMLSYVKRTNNEIYKYNINAFSELNNETKYWVDKLNENGFIRKIKGRYAMSFGSKDLELVEKFKDFLKSNHPIKCSKIHEEHYFKIEINCPYLIDDLKMWNFIPETIENE